MSNQFLLWLSLFLGRTKKRPCDLLHAIAIFFFFLLVCNKAERFDDFVGNLIGSKVCVVDLDVIFEKILAVVGV